MDNKVLECSTQTRKAVCNLAFENALKYNHLAKKTSLSTQPCVWSSETIKVVSSCPTTVEETDRAARIKKCYGIGLRQNCTSPEQFKYHCVYSLKTNSLVEVCATEIFIEGLCLVYNAALFKLDLIERVKCTDFPTPCPARYVSTKAHLDAPCYKFINLTSSLTLPKEKTDEKKTTDELLWNLIPTMFAVMFVVIIILVIVWIVRKRKQRQGKRKNHGLLRKGKETDIKAYKDMEEMEFLGSETEHNVKMAAFKSETEDRKGKETDIKAYKDMEEMEFLGSETEHNVKMAAFKSETEDRKGKETDIKAYKDMEEMEFLGSETELNVKMAAFKSETEDKWVGNYNKWKTKISNRFSTLTDDEVWVLFCFLCSDSGPPDFTDTEWLDMLNEIRQIVYRQENPVTSEEAQQTLDRLKSRDYLWENQDKITEDTKSETMYRIASKHLDVIFFYSSYDTASVNLRLHRYNIKPGEKCVRSVGCDRVLIRRLQMNILTHVTMEDREIYDKISRILNIPENKIKSSKDELDEFLTDLKSGGNTHDTVDHVTWLWRYRRQARPDIVRSCIGLHPHWDIYIIDNKPYRKPSEYLTNPPGARCLLYSLLLAEKYQLNLNEQSNSSTRVKIKDRYFSNITNDGSFDLPGGIKEEKGLITFISDDIRHDVMYAFVTECLREDSDLEFFLTTASRDVISEYCRSWDYKRSEGERCLYVPERPEKMHDLLIDKLQLDIITHCTVSDERIHGRISILLGVPREVLQWDQEARERYVEYAKRGTQTVHHARGMIVGCAGAGKTTLLKRLLGCNEKDIKEVKSTEGLQVHEEVFELRNETKSLKGKMRRVMMIKN
ncbi:uncharacterized protein LOC134228503 [Saccostrea cucullata]|uniref:uncharacterized protein LOC134228503 n=1 Tax=Saccostrea cuccullata TaxID=36930 RepID=UPI002ED17D19